MDMMKERIYKTMRLASEPPTVKFGLTEEQRKQLHFEHIAISENGK